MKTLVIHPTDPSTTFLNGIYENIPDITLIQGGVSKYELMLMVESHDRVMIMGHGWPKGLFSVGQFPNLTYGDSIIDESFVPLLRQKNNTVFIWCNADKFVEFYGLQGFYSGMFISEVGEAAYCGLPGIPQEIVDESNYGFVDIISKYITEDKEIIHTKVVEEYGLLAEENPVALYNNIRLYKS